jgi:hypothetical protein
MRFQRVIFPHHSHHLLEITALFLTSTVWAKGMLYRGLPFRRTKSLKHLDESMESMNRDQYSSGGGGDAKREGAGSI